MQSAARGKIGLHAQRIHRDHREGRDWFIAYSPEIPRRKRAGHTADEARQNLGESISLIVADRREDALTWRSDR
jgi:predicted RNase H-like HicB family nuclease